MEDLRPSNFKDLALRIFTDKELATTFIKNENRQNKYKKYKINQLKTYCDLVTSEQHEHNECTGSGGLSAFGTDFSMLSKNIAKAIVDWIVGEWVDYSF